MVNDRLSQALLVSSAGHYQCLEHCFLSNPPGISCNDRKLLVFCRILLDYRTLFVAAGRLMEHNQVSRACQFSDLKRDVRLCKSVLKIEPVRPPDTG